MQQVFLNLCNYSNITKTLGYDLCKIAISLDPKGAYFKIKAQKEGDKMSETEAQRRANLKYRKKAYNTFLLRFRTDTEPTKQTIQEAATKQNESFHEYIINAIIQRMENEKGR